jgi:GNAT superfamily N-acetyltransferase
MNFQRIFEQNSDIFSKMKMGFEKLGLFVTIPEHDDDYAISAADNERDDYFFRWPEHTGFFATWHEIDDGFHAHLDTLVIAKSERGKGLAAKILEIFVDAFDGKLKEISLNDQSNGFWSHQEIKYPNIKFIYISNQFH